MNATSQSPQLAPTPRIEHHARTPALETVNNLKGTTIQDLNNILADDSDGTQVVNETDFMEEIANHQIESVDTITRILADNPEVQAALQELIEQYASQAGTVLNAEDIDDTDFDFGVTDEIVNIMQVHNMRICDGLFLDVEHINEVVKALLIRISNQAQEKTTPQYAGL